MQSQFSSNRMSIISNESVDSEENSLNFLLINSIGTHWHENGLLKNASLDSKKRKKARFRRVFSSLTTAIQIPKAAVSLYLGWDCLWYLKYSGDYFIGFGSQAIWFYMNLTIIVVCTASLFLPSFCQKYWSSNWFEIFGAMSGRTPLTALKLDEKYVKKLLMVSRPILQFLDFVLYFPYISAGGFALVYFLEYKSWEAAILAGFWGGQAVVWIGAAARALIPGAYLAIFSFYVRFRSNQIVERIKEIEASVAPSRRRHSTFLISQKVENVLADQRHLVDQIRSCNRLYRQITALLIPYNGFPVLCSLYASQHSNGVHERLLMVYIFIVAGLLTSSYYLMGGMVARATRANYVAWTKAAARLAFLSRQKKKLFVPRLNVRTGLHLLGLLEMLTAKKHRVAVSCLHWFVLKDFNFFKVVFAQTN